MRRAWLPVGIALVGAACTWPVTLATGDATTGDEAGGPETGGEGAPDVTAHDAPADVTGDAMRDADAGNDAGMPDGASAGDSGSGADARPDVQGMDAPPFDADASPEVGPVDGALDVDSSFDVFESGFDVFTVDAGPPWDGGPTTTIATGENPVSLVADDVNVYWVNSGYTVVDCPVSGCPGNVPNLLALNGIGYGYADDLTVTGGSVYYLATSYAIDDCAVAGCALTPTTYEPGIAFDAGVDAGLDGGLDGGAFDGGFLSIYALASDAANVYFSDGTSLLQCPVAATCAAPLTLAKVAAGDLMSAPALSATEVFYCDSGFSTSSIQAVPVGGGAPRTVCTLAPSSFVSLTALLYAGSYVYFVDAYDPHSIYECPAAGGGMAAVYWSDVAPTGLATDGARLFWTNNASSGDVGTCAIGATCTSPSTVATAQDYPTSIAVNSSSVFWATATAVYAAAK